ncbi:MAG: FAD-dependent oxidoreductase, partial [Actinobacteria bacterium]|nr:FAD-dependent oxidoreductase [Actinomycetota bacterium]
GHDVTIYEQFEVGHRRGSSHGESRVYRYSYPDARYVMMMTEAMVGWRRLESDSKIAILQRTGGLDTGKDLAAHAAALDAHDIPFEFFDGRTASARWPFLSLSDEEILYQSEGGVVHADKAWHSLVGQALEWGARLLEGRRIDDLGRDGFVDYDVTVVTAGGWARALLATAGIDLAVKPTRETVAFFRTRELIPTLVDWGDPSVYALHDPGYGLKVGEHIAGPPTDPDTEGIVDQTSILRLQEWVRRRYPAIDPTPARTETCIYTNTVDEHFVLERHGNIVVGSPCSGHGFKFAPLIGDRLADLIET